MQQTADAVANVTKDQAVDAVLETTLVSGSSYFFFAVAETAGVLTVAVAVAVMTACGSSSCYSSVAALVETEAVMVAVADATTAATKIR